MLSRRRLLAGTAAGAGLWLACTVRRTARVRDVERVVAAAPSRDGAGVSLRRALGGRALPLLDPFLLLDEIHSADPADYRAGFPQHPHRGFETVSYVLRGGFAHADSVGNHGLIADGGAQWMTAGHGIVHSEMPRPTATPELWGLQLWVNLPAARKLIAPRYQDLGAAAIPTVTAGDATVRVIAGAVANRRGPVDGIDVAPTMLDVDVPAGGQLVHPLPGGDSAFVYVLAGELAIGERGATAGAGQLAVLTTGDELRVASARGGRGLVLAATPIGEPVARRGPFVMNSQAELDQAFADYRRGRLTSL
jgi:redox-sensitive bicupin YhaK (pirin superfamily)